MDEQLLKRLIADKHKALERIREQIANVHAGLAHARRERIDQIRLPAHYALREHRRVRRIIEADIAALEAIAA